MRPEELQDALNFVDEELIKDVDALRVQMYDLDNPENITNVKKKAGKVRKTGWYKWVAAAAVALCAVGLFLWYRPVTAAAEDLMQGITPQKVETMENLSAGNVAVADFGIRLFQASMREGESTLISPLSVISALAMTVNGAEGETRTQMEQVLGLTTEELNEYMYTYMSRLPKEEAGQLQLANSMWFRDTEDFRAEQDFLQTNADYYGADIYKRKFDKYAVEEINQWVSQNTNNMIPQIIDEIPTEAVMYLINALAFEAEWIIPYEEHAVQDGVFTLENGTGRQVELMHGKEYIYLEDELATGFVKNYKRAGYAFVALLPKEGVSVAEYVNALSGESLQRLLSNVSDEPVNTALPKFKTEYKDHLGWILADMGMPDAFDVYKADFSGIGKYLEGNVYIGDVLHKTYIEVGEQGTRAGAVTAVAMAGGTSGPLDKPKEVILDRPFVYMIIDTENKLPIFIGTLMDVE